MAALSYLKNERFGQAFSLGNVFRKAFTLPYLKAVAIAVFYSIFIFLVAAIASALFAFLGTFFNTVITLVLISMASFVIGVTSMTLFGMAFAEIESGKVELGKAPAVKAKKIVKKKAVKKVVKKKKK